MVINYFAEIRRKGSAVPDLSKIPDINVTNENGANLLHVAIAYKNFTAISELMRLDINVNVQDYKGQTPLHYAAIFQSQEAAEAILAKGGDISLVDSHGNSALWSAVFHARGKYSMVELMLRNGGAKLANQKNLHGRSPIDFAKQIDDEHLAQLLEG